MAWSRLGSITRNMAWHTVTVKSGDTLARLASGVKPAQTVAYIKKWNGLNSDKLSAGQKIKIYPYYVVQWGDTLTDISKSFATTNKILDGLNPSITNINLIYPNSKIRLPEGREPESEAPKAKEPAPKIPAPPKPKEEKEPTTKVEKNTNTKKSTNYADDDFPAHRFIAGDYYLRIGDVQFVVPPEFIKVNSESETNITGALRQKDSAKTKNGQRMTTIDLQLWFTSLEEINGFSINSPIDEQVYSMDGLRSLIAQFKRMPFLPIENEFLNDVMDIHVVAMSNLTFLTVDGFPGVIQANLTLYKADVSPYTDRPNWAYDQMFMYPLFRWYYQQMLVEKGPTYTTTYLQPVDKANFTDKFKMKILDEAYLRNNSGRIKMSDVEADTEGAFNEIELPDDLVCTNIMCTMGTSLSPINMDMMDTPTFQYLGSSETMFSVVFETTSRDAIAALERIYATGERYSRMYRNKFVSGYIQIENPIINMTGVTNVMILGMATETIQGDSETFRIQLQLVSYKSNQAQDQRVKGFNSISVENAEAIMRGTLDLSKTYTFTKNSPWFLLDEGIAEGMLNGMELYPDLELPTHFMVQYAVKKINAHREKKGQSPIPYQQTPPKMHYREYGSEAVYARDLNGTICVDPDFYFTYPDIADIDGIDDELSAEIISNQLTINQTLDAVNGSAAIQKGLSGQAGGSGLSFTGSSGGGSGAKKYSYTGQDKFAGTVGLKSKVAGTDKWDGLIQKYASKHGIDPAVLKTIMAIESGGYEKAGNTSSGATGLMQIWPDPSNTKKTREQLLNPDTNMEEACILYKGKVAAVQKRSPIGPVDQKMVFWYYYGYKSDTSSKGYQDGKSYSEVTMHVYSNLKATSSSAPLVTTPGKAGAAVTTYSNLINHSEGAEVETITRIPKTDKEESVVHVDDDRMDIIMRSMQHSSQLYSRRGSMVRAFPTYLLLFIDEGVWVDYRRLWNNYYLYHAIEEISIVKNRNQPVDTAYIRLQNIYGALNMSDKASYYVDGEKKQDFSKAQSGEEAPHWYEWMTSPGGVAKYWMKTWFPTVNGKMAQMRMEHIERGGVDLRPGARVHIRLGYGSTASLMPIAFNGKITELGSGDVVDVVAQSDGLELINPHPGWANNSRVDIWDMGSKEAKEMLDALMTDREGIFPFDTWNNMVMDWSDRFNKASKFGIEHFGTVLDESKNTFLQFIGDAFFITETASGYDATKNIYSSKSSGAFGASSGEDNWNYWLTKKSVWDVFQFFTSVIPGYETKVIEHGFHSTIFYGRPWWYVKYKYFVRGDAAKAESYWEAIRAAQQFHKLDSLNDIISNGIKTNSENLATVVVPMYTYDDGTRTTYPLYLDKFIRADMQKTDIIDTSALQDYPLGDWVASGLNLIKEVLAGKKIPTSVERAALNAGQYHMRVKLREMYQGELIVIGDPAIRPGDLLSITDVYTQMFGPAEVGRVVHSLSFDTGFTTSIKPDLVSFIKTNNEGFSPEQERLRWVLTGSLTASSYLLRRFGMRFLVRKPKFMVKRLDKAMTFMRNLRRVRNLTMVSSLAGGPPGWVAFVVEGVIFFAIDAMIVTLMDSFIRHEANLGIAPLWYKNLPYVAGIDGHKNLIPGIMDPNYYGPIGQQSTQSSYSGQTAAQIGAGSYSLGGADGTAPGQFNGPIATGIPLNTHIVWPTPVPYRRLSSPFDWRVYQDTAHNRSKKRVGKPQFHEGIDIADEQGTQIFAVSSGKVIRTADYGNGSYGKLVVIAHTLSQVVPYDEVKQWKSGKSQPAAKKYKIKAFYSVYGHLHRIDVKEGDIVQIGQVIGLMGTTGSSTGNHLHFEIRTTSTDFNHSGKVGQFPDITTFDKGGQNSYPISPSAFLDSLKAYKIPKVR